VELTGDLYASPPRQRMIQHDDVWVMRTREFDSSVAVISGQHAKPVKRQVCAVDCSEFELVLNEENGGHEVLLGRQTARPESMWPGKLRRPDI
jgi:hypothetical protein